MIPAELTECSPCLRLADLMRLFDVTRSWWRTFWWPSSARGSGGREA